MYAIKKAILRLKGDNKTYEEVDVTNTKIFDIVNQYKDGYIILRSPSLSVDTLLSLDTLRTTLAVPIYNMYLKDWLRVLGSKTIPSSGTGYSIYRSSVEYADVFQTDYTVKLVNPNDIGDVQNYPKSERTDVLMTKELSDYTNLNKRVLTVVNGLLHLNVPRTGGLLIKSAGSTLNVSNDNNLGILNFENVADVTQIPITDKMIGTPDPIMGLKASAYIRLKTNTTNKTILLSFCGRLYACDGIVDKINNTGLIRLNLDRLDLLQIVQDCKVKIDLSSLKLDERLYQYKATKIADIVERNDVIAGLLKLPQTFIILVDTPTMVKDIKLVTATGFDGSYETEQEVRLPAIDSKNQIPCYYKRVFIMPDGKLRRLYMSTTQKVQSVYHTGNVDSMQWVNNAIRVIGKDYELPALMDLHTETLSLNKSII